MNLLLWSTYCAHPVGGMERTSLEIALQLHHRGHRVIIAGAYDNAPELRAKIPPDIPFYPLDMHSSRRKPHLAAARLAARLLREHRIQVVSAHGSVFALHEVCRRRRVPLAWTIHGIAPRETGWVTRLKTAAVARVMAHPTTHVIGVSQCTAESVARQFPRLDRTRLHFIHTGGMDDRALLELPEPRPGPPWQLGFVGRIVDQKQPLELVRLAHCLTGRLDYQIHIFGDGPLLPELKAAAPADRFQFHGYWTAGRPSMVSQFHLLVHTAKEEPLGLVLIESNLGARPVAAYGVDGVLEIIANRETGIHVAPRDVTALAAAVCELTGPRYLEYARAARQRAAQHFTLGQMMDQYEKLFERLCAHV
jgi:glycosyltransferase involved in cell wall biosynthesis